MQCPCANWGALLLRITVLELNTAHVGLACLMFVIISFHIYNLHYFQKFVVVILIDVGITDML